MKTLIACECSGIVRDEFIKQGHNAISCDLINSDRPGPHYVGDVRDILFDDWDMIIAFPPCTYLTCTGNRWFKNEYKERYPNRLKDREEAINFFMLFANHKCKKVVIENPIGIMSSIWKTPNQIIQPFQFGHEMTKATCLWLKGCARLKSTKLVRPKFITLKNGKRMSELHYNSFKFDPIKRAKIRSETFEGVAKAMAKQWGKQEKVYGFDL